MQQKPQLFVVETDPQQTDEIRRAFGAEGFEVSIFTRCDDAQQALRRRAPEVLIAAGDLPDGHGADLFGLEEPQQARSVCILLVSDPSIHDVVGAMKHGATDVLERPVFVGHLVAVVGKALAERRKAAAPAAKPMMNDPLSRPPIVGRSEALRRLLDKVELVTRAPKATVMIEGDSGTGKELIARAIHFDGPRRLRPFLAVNCATLTANLLEAELFGYEKGAFTGALSTGKKGLFEAAEGGTLFLDEVGELAPDLQARLLRVLQEGTFKRVGGINDIRADVRVIAATNRDLRVEVQEGRFRADLYYRLNVVPIRVPSLQERRDDILVLGEHFLAEFSREMGKQILGFSTQARERLQDYAWPGNVRELRNVCEYAVIVCDGDLIEGRHLTLPESDAADRQPGIESLALRDMSLKTMEGELIRMVLNDTHFNITRAAGILGINRSTLYNKMRDYGLQRDERPLTRQSV